MSKELGAGGRFDIFLDSGKKATLLLTIPRSLLTRLESLFSARGRNFLQLDLRA